MSWPQLACRDGIPDLDSLWAACAGPPERMTDWLEARLLGHDPNVDRLHGETPDQLFVWLRRREPRFADLLGSAWQRSFERNLARLADDASRRTIEELLSLADRWRDFPAALPALEVLARLGPPPGREAGTRGLRGVAVVALRHAPPPLAGERRRDIVAAAEQHLGDPVHYSTAFTTLLALARAGICGQDDETLRRWAGRYRGASLRAAGPTAWARRRALAEYDAACIIEYLGRPEAEKPSWRSRLAEQSAPWPAMEVSHACAR